MRGPLLIALLCATPTMSGCTKRDRQAEVVRDVEQLSHDQCLAEKLSKSERERVVRGAKAGRIRMENLDGYISDILEARKRAKVRNMSVETFCGVQLNIWRKHFGR